MDEEWVSYETDNRAVPDPKDAYFDTFKQGWAEAEQGIKYSEECLAQLSWRNLGWRFGRLFGDTPDELKHNLYKWSIDRIEQ